VSKRPIHDKQIKGIRKLARQTPPAYIDLVDYLKVQGHAQTSGAARKLIAAGKVRSESHPLGREEIEEFTFMGTKRLTGRPRVPASLRDTIVVKRT
jgi:hypothetical protein